MRIISKPQYEEWAKSHRVLWCWVAETGKFKGMWPGWHGNLDLYPRYTGKYVPSYMHREIKNNCFACSICGRFSCKTGCPIIHFRIKENYPCSWEHDNAYYNMWRSATNAREKEKYATLIAELPWFNYEIYEKYHGVELYSFDIVEIAKVYGPVEFTY